MHQEQECETIAWAEELAYDEVAVLHLLAVCSEYQRKSIGMAMLQESICLALREGKRSLRLDVLCSNLPAQRMYERAEFSYRGK